MLVPTDSGLYCPAGDFYLDPWAPVARAVITHAHADHARPGHDAYLATPLTAAMMRHRLGALRVQEAEFGAALDLGGVRLSFHPSGHLPGAAQVRLEHRGAVWVVSGDYKTEADGLAEPWEPLACDTFVSECTFGLPVFRWRPQAEVLAEIAAWWRDCAAAGRAAVLGVYSLGKAQRVLAGLSPGPGPVMVHGAIEASNAVLRAAGVVLPDTVPVTPEMPRGAAARTGALVLAPPSALDSAWMRRLGPAETALASGWMALRGIRRRRGAARGFVLSDHADWPGLNAAVRATGAARVWLTHGYAVPFARYLAETGLAAEVPETRFARDGAEDEA